MRHLVLTLAAVAITAVTAAVPAAASSSAPPVAVIEDCRERAVLVPGVEELVRQRVPAQFELVRDPLGRPLLVVDGARCEQVTVNEPAGPTTFAWFFAVIESPDGAGCLSRWPLVGHVKPDVVPFCNLYGLFGAHTNRAVVKWVRSLVPDIPLYRVRDLVFEAEGFDPTRLGEPFRFRAGPRTPSPFELDAIARDGAVEGPLTLSGWFTGPSGTTKARFESDEVAIGQMDATLRAAPGSEMAALLGTETPTPLGGLTLRYPYGEIAVFAPNP